MSDREPTAAEQMRMAAPAAASRLTASRVTAAAPQHAIDEVGKVTLAPAARFERYLRAGS